MNRTIILLLGVVVAVTATEKVQKAVVVLKPHNASIRNVTGELVITQDAGSDSVHITGKICGLTEGLHGFHVHEKGDLRNGCISPGAHFNPKKVNHGGPEHSVRHVGDLGNIHANAQGEATIDVTDLVISLNGPNSILGRTIIVHAMEDDLGKGNHTLSLTTGNSGDRWACGIVGIV